MASHSHRRATPSQPSLPSGPTLQVWPREPTVVPEESFNLNDVSGSDDDDNNSANDPTDHSCNHVKATTAERADLGVNNPDLQTSIISLRSVVTRWSAWCVGKSSCMFTPQANFDS